LKAKKKKMAEDAKVKARQDYEQRIGFEL